MSGKVWAHFYNKSKMIKSERKLFWTSFIFPLSDTSIELSYLIKSHNLTGYGNIWNLVTKYDIQNITDCI